MQADRDNTASKETAYFRLAELILTPVERLPHYDIASWCHMHVGKSSDCNSQEWHEIAVM